MKPEPGLYLCNEQSCYWLVTDELAVAFGADAKDSEFVGATYKFDSEIDMSVINKFIDKWICINLPEF